MTEHTQAEHVLIVEDDPMLADLLASVLQEHGAETTQATTLQAGLALLESTNTVTRLVTDFQLSGTADCVPLLAKAYASQPPVTCVVMSGNIGAIDMEHLRSGLTSAQTAPALLQKPFGIEQFIETVFATPRLAGAR